ncbi:hypothetical protein SJ05684_c10220 [Sinorhizobium sojae CCBAU 05684]|uniref:Uncharacterized protein n=1 Tax=Sinorhizobium sojae CCBAU 05684 TaxID=716928 RepID=A0A249P977_9HYPH|nr:hypothetical protein [Sinorhizobium sojae]ASY62480.1 hypothetical protein SJ05684_c10220 [Sinorhizobium sojae CCBAU 05684]
MGTMVTRYRVENAKGCVLTDEGFFTSERDDAAEFTDEDAAHEEASSFPGATVEEFRRYSDFADLIVRGARLDHREAIDEFNRRAG